MIWGYNKTKSVQVEYFNFEVVDDAVPCRRLISIGESKVPWMY